MDDSVFVSGMGVCSPIGTSLDQMLQALQAGQSGIQAIRSFDCSKLTMRHAGEVNDIPNAERYPQPLYRIWDRGTRMAMHAAGDALLDANLDPSLLASGRVGVCIGTSGSGQYQNARFRLDKSFPIDPELVFYLSRNAPHFQSSQIAAQYGIRGPNLAIGAATAGGGIALATAMAWLRSGRTDAVLVGGSEAFSLLNVLGFDQLGLTIPHPCTPFSGTPGMTFGEGAGYFVLETAASVRRRDAQVHAELKSVAIRADGFDPILFDPSGGGQARAMRAALVDAQLEPRAIDWIRASGTGGRDQDLAETIAIKSIFDQPPPVSSLEPFVGHANGAGPSIQLVAAILCMKSDFIPPTLGLTDPRPGCDLDYVAEGPRNQPLQHIMCNTLAFGGVNCAIVVSKVGDESRLSSSLSKRPMQPWVHVAGSANDDRQDEVVITGIGLISPHGCGGSELAGRFLEQRVALNRDQRLEGINDSRYGVVQEFSPKKHCPAVKLRGCELLTQYAAGAATLALDDANLRKPMLTPDRVGLATAITRPSGSVFERLFAELQLNGFRPSVGRLMLRNGRFMIASQLAHWFDLRGHSSTASLGVGSGLHALASAADQLRTDPSLDAMVVLACDELSTFSLRMMQQGGQLAQSEHQWALYSPTSHHFVPGEGSAAVVIERRRFAMERGARVLAEIAGSGLSFDGLSGQANIASGQRPIWEAMDDTAMQMQHCFNHALTVAGVDANEIDLLMGNGTGIWSWDVKELDAIHGTFGERAKLGCVNGQTGICEASSALFNLAAAIYALRSDGTSTNARHAEASLNRTNHSLNGRLANEDLLGSKVSSHVAIASSALQHAMVIAGTEQGHNASIILKKAI